MTKECSEKLAIGKCQGSSRKNDESADIGVEYRFLLVLLNAL
jgi:hypothetical protein